MRRRVDDSRSPDRPSQKLSEIARLFCRSAGSNPRRDRLVPTLSVLTKPGVGCARSCVDSSAPRSSPMPATASSRGPRSRYRANYSDAYWIRSIFSCESRSRHAEADQPIRQRNRRLRNCVRRDANTSKSRRSRRGGKHSFRISASAAPKIPSQTRNVGRLCPHMNLGGFNMRNTD